MPTYPADLPEAAKAHTREGAIAMAKYFVRAVDEAAVSNDASVVRAVSKTSCVACSSLEQRVATNTTRGVRQSRPSISIEAVLSDSDGSTPDLQRVQLLIGNDATEYVDAAGAVTQHFAAEKYTVRVVMSWLGGAWTVDAAGKVTT